jgi:8-oxo-dGTP pyrophosphatase MutT (NUDIX family)
MYCCCWHELFGQNNVCPHQAAIVQNDHLQVHDRPTGEIFWLFPGGGREPGETEEQCVEREVLEETHLRVEVVRFLFEAPDIPERGGNRLRMYLCQIRGGAARPGCEPEVDGDGHQTIQDLGWFDLHQRETWDAMLDEERITYRLLQRVRAELGFMQSD